MKPPPADADTAVTESDREDKDLMVDVLIESEAWQMLPDAEDIARRAIAAAAASSPGFRRRSAELSVLLCDDETIAALNGRWRGQEKATNVLSFPALPFQGAELSEPVPDRVPQRVPLGDIAIACETLVREAGESGKSVSDHFSHLVVHGFLHLIGHDHEVDDDAERMERLERDILVRIGVADPYAARDADV
jgi:probable rRNA maturation factor